LFQREIAKKKHGDTKKWSEFDHFCEKQWNRTAGRESREPSFEVSRFTVDEDGK